MFETDGSGGSLDLLVMVFVMTIAWAYMRGWFSSASSQLDTALGRRPSKPREPYTTLQEVDAAIRQQVSQTQHPCLIPYALHPKPTPTP